MKYGNSYRKARKHFKAVLPPNERNKILLYVDIRIKGKEYLEVLNAKEQISSISEKSNKIRKFYRDGVSDQSMLFEKLHSLSVKPVTKTRGAQ
jgi:hypothetical protein